MRSAASTPSSRASWSVSGRSLPVEAPAPEHDVHAERRGAADHFLADVADAEQAERLAEQALRLRVFLLVPLPGAQLGDVVGHAAIEREHQRERQLRDRDRVLARTVRDVDAALDAAATSIVL